jgi:hypothetical protein
VGGGQRDARPNHNAEAPPASFRYLLRMRVWRVLLLALAAQALPLACGSKRAPFLVDVRPRDAGNGGQDAGLLLGDAAEVPSGPCGSQSIPAITNPPNLSFIIDHSGSMGEELAGSGLSKYENARVALSHVLGAIGHRVNYGALIFPGLAGVTGCEAGDELMPVAPGDPPSYARDGKTGPRLKDLLGRLSIANVDGGTPAAATLSKALATLSALEGDTYVILITDGAPNCNEDLSCKPSACIPNIEGLTYGGFDCSTGVNCCAPTTEHPQANLSCVDEQASLQAVQALTDAGIKTFVVGMPGSEPYENLLDAMADVGGTARTGSPKYYSVADTDALEQALKAIAASVAISCEIPLDYEPPDRDFLNVYFDGKVVEYDPEAGWEWTDDGHVAIRGAACEQLSAGEVLEVQILAGCKTVVK